MDDEGPGRTLVRAGIVAVVSAGLILGLLVLRNWLAFQVIANAVGQPAYVFPTSVVQPSFMLTPWAVGTPWYEINLGYWSTPTPTMEGGVYIGNP